MAAKSRKTATKQNRSEMPVGHKFWSVRCEEDGKDNIGHLFLYGEIASETWWGDEVTPQVLKDDIEALGEISTLKVHIFSNGGDVFAGFAIYSLLKQQSADIVIYIEGIAASMATVIAMAGDEVYISSTAMMMIHNPMFVLWGYYNTADLSAMIKDLDKIREPIIGAYVERTGLSREDVIEYMDGEDGQGTWFTASEALDASLVDDYIPEEYEESLGAVAYLGGDTYEHGRVTIDLSMYENAPKLLGERRTTRMSKKTRKVAKGRVKPKAKVVDELVTITCPVCEAEFDADIPDDAEGIVEITCPECDAELSYDVATGEVTELEAETGEEEPTEPSEAAEEGDEGEEEDEGAVSAAVKRALAADRKRMVALDRLAKIHPDQAEIIEDAKKQGTSFETASLAVMDAIDKAEKEGRKSGEKFLDGMKADFGAAAKVGAAPHSGTEGTGNKTLDGINESVSLFNKR